MTQLRLLALLFGLAVTGAAILYFDRELPPAPPAEAPAAVVNAPATANAPAETTPPDETATAPAAETPPAETAPSAATAPAKPAPEAPAAQALATPAQPAAPAAVAQQPLPERPAQVPSFDIVRVDKEGKTVLAGRGPASTKVEIRLGETVLEEVKTDQRGQWVATPTLPAGTADKALTLMAQPDGQAPVPSAQQVVVALPEPGPDGAVAPAETGAAAVLLEAKGGGRLLQAPGQLGTDGDLTLMMVDYDASGALRLSGEAPPGVPIRIYIDNRPSGEAVSDAKGAWISQLDKALPPGDYTLRLDQIDAKGQAVARLETPLTRVEQPPVPGNLQVDYVVVQPGNSLWRIARRVSGSGVDYVYIFEANKGLIRDPNLIYPGQVFELPKPRSTG